MLISVNKRFVFVANTKTASTSIEAALAPYAEIERPGGPNNKHFPLGKIWHNYRFLFDQPEYPFHSFFRFGVMRDPFDWINSWFRYRRSNKVDSPLPSDITFAEFWRKNDWNISYPDGRPYLQSQMFLNRKNELLADMVIPYERMDEILPEIFSALGLKAKLPRLNVTALKDVEIDIPQEIRDEMLEHYAPDLAMYARLDEIVETGMSRLAMRRSVSVSDASVSEADAAS